MMWDVDCLWCILYCSCLWTVILLARPFWDVPKQFDMTLRHTNRRRSRAVHGGRADHHPSRTCEISRTFTNQNRRQLSERTNRHAVMTGAEVCKLGRPRKQATNPIQIRECVAGLNLAMVITMNNLLFVFHDYTNIWVSPYKRSLVGPHTMRPNGHFVENSIFNTFSNKFLCLNMFYDVQNFPRNHLEMVLSLCDKYFPYKLQFVPIFTFWIPI